MGKLHIIRAEETFKQVTMSYLVSRRPKTEAPTVCDIQNGYACYATIISTQNRLHAVIKVQNNKITRSTKQTILSSPKSS